MSRQEFGVRFSDTGEVSECLDRADAEANLAYNRTHDTRHAVTLVSRTVTDWAEAAA